MFVRLSQQDLSRLMDIVSDRVTKQENNNKVEIKQLQHHLAIARRMNAATSSRSKSGPILSASTRAKVRARSVSFATPWLSKDEVNRVQMDIKQKIIMVKDDFESIEGSFEKVQIFIQKFTNLHRVDMVHIKHMILKGLKKERYRTMRRNTKIDIMSKELKTHRISKEKLNELQINLKALLNGLNNNMEQVLRAMYHM